MAEQRADAGDEFIHRERLGQIIIRAEVQPRDPVVRLPACGEDEQRYRAPARAKLPEHAQAVAAGKIQIQHDRVVWLRKCECERLLAIIRLFSTAR